MWKSWKSGAAGHIEIMRLLPEAEAKPDTCSHVSFGNPVRQVLSRSSACCKRQRQDPTRAHMFHLEIPVRQVLSRSSACCQRQDPTQPHMFHLGNPAGLIEIVACCRRQRQDPTHAHMFQLENPVGLIEIVRLLPEAEARPDTRRLAHMFHVEIRYRSYRDPPLAAGGRGKTRHAAVGSHVSCGNPVQVISISVMRCRPELCGGGVQDVHLGASTRRSTLFQTCTSAPRWFLGRLRATQFEQEHVC